MRKYCAILHQPLTLLENQQHSAHTDKISKTKRRTSSYQFSDRLLDFPGILRPSYAASPTICSPARLCLKGSHLFSVSSPHPRYLLSLQMRHVNPLKNVLKRWSYTYSFLGILLELFPCLFKVILKAWTLPAFLIVYRAAAKRHGYIAPSSHLFQKLLQFWRVTFLLDGNLFFQFSINWN